jgi:hypothetical protein
MATALAENQHVSIDLRTEIESEVEALDRRIDGGEEPEPEVAASAAAQAPDPDPEPVVAAPAAEPVVPSGMVRQSLPPVPAAGSNGHGLAAVLPETAMMLSDFMLEIVDDAAVLAEDNERLREKLAAAEAEAAALRALAAEARAELAAREQLEAAQPEYERLANQLARIRAQAAVVREESQTALPAPPA